MLEVMAAQAPDERAELYRQAGDRYLEAEADPEAALRCYGRSLDAGGAEGLTVALDDNWLLMAIKDARRRESDAK
jgi:hypothetical protein